MARNVFWEISRKEFRKAMDAGIIIHHHENVYEWDEETMCDVLVEKEYYTLKGVQFRLYPFYDEDENEIFRWFACGGSAMEGHFKEYPFVVETKDY